MTVEEKQRLVGLLADPQRWCQGAEARDRVGEAVAYSDPEAAAWDLTGALCHLFGWRRACELFPQIQRHIAPPLPHRAPRLGPGIDALVALQDYNDGENMTHAEMLACLENMPVWRGAGADGDGRGCHA